MRLSSHLQAVLGTGALDVVVLNDVPPPLARHVVESGELLHCRDHAPEHAFRRDVALRTADLEPFLRRMRRIKLEALRR